MKEILDASVTAKWFVRAGERGLAAADEVRRRVLLHPDGFAAPTLMLYEFHATLCQRLADVERVRTASRLLHALGVRIVRPDRVLLELATEIALSRRLTMYDAAYVALARHLGGRWLTFDEAAVARLDDRKHARALPLE